MPPPSPCWVATLADWMALLLTRAEETSERFPELSIAPPRRPSPG